MKTTIEMPDDLFRKASEAAALRGQSVKQWIADVLRREVTPAPISGDEAERKVAADIFASEIESLAAQVGKSWQGSQDAAAAIREQRRG